MANTIYVPKSDILDLITETNEAGGFTDYSDYSNLWDAVDYIPSADVQPTKWISVKDRLPDKLCECLGVVEGEVTEVSYRPKQKEFICVWSMCDADGFKPLSDDAVTHWMPLPKPPKDGEQNE